MEELATQIKREELNEKLWGLVKGWGDRQIVNDIVGSLPVSLVEDYIEQVENKSEEELTPREAVHEGQRRSDLFDRLNKVTGEEILDMDREALVKEMALHLQIPALDEFCTHLETDGTESCRTWRPKLVSINIGRKDKKWLVYGYFKTDVTEEELKACHKAYLRQDRWEYDCDVPEGRHWKLDTSLEEDQDSIAKNAGWVRYIVGELE